MSVHGMDAVTARVGAQSPHSLKVLTRYRAGRRSKVQVGGSGSALESSLGPQTRGTRSEGPSLDCAQV